ncbi:hypothetical protein QZN01_20975 [Burkholderia cenocepacia]|uniref:hypothetical protein n=1 Tax=Burkholderia cenocepacia TaxID=95486 RepID=UPI0026531590|nr:hypothetical protein [Burkholderia cenocepacia]MDN7825129.1 hypothetical protein [Burkholderia cenocepacia]
MSNVIDWSKYGRGPKRIQMEIEIVYSGDGQQVWCVAKFPIERYDVAKEMIERQIQYWERDRG